LSKLIRIRKTTSAGLPLEDDCFSAKATRSATKIVKSVLVLEAIEVLFASNHTAKKKIER